MKRFRTSTERSRRQVLAAGTCSALSVLAGCSGVLPWTGSTGTPGGDTPTGTQSPTREPTPTAETDVVGLSYHAADGSRNKLEFFVTLLAPEGEGVGATWWQVERLGREKIARKSFATPRGGRFQTSKIVEIPDDVGAVVVRGHGRRHGYGGRVMLADLDAGLIRIERQGTEPKSFEGYTFQS